MNTPDMLVRAARILQDWKKGFYNENGTGPIPIDETEHWLKEYSRKEGNTVKTGLT